MYRGFPQELVASLRCPADGGSLEAEGEDDPIRSGILRCGRCRNRLAVRDGIVDVLSKQPSVEELARREIAARDRLAEGVEARHSRLATELEVPSTLAGLDLSGRDVVDLGCGTGRITRRILEVARSVVAIDFSRKPLDAFARSIQGKARVGLVHGDVTSAPLAGSAFDVALSTQVAEHLPTREARAGFFASVREALRPGGFFVCTLYHYDLRRRLGPGDREGTHPSGIYYRHFSRREIRAELAPHFVVRSIRPIKIAIPYLIRLPLPWGPISRGLERVPLINSLGYLLRIVAQRPIRHFAPLPGTGDGPFGGC
jgi:SAM-dependent methyltransferase